MARADIYLEDDDRLFFLALAGTVVKRCAWTVHALCLMTNHFHLVVEATRVKLSAGMHRLNGAYAERFNDKYCRSGHLFGDRFFCKVIQDEDHLVDACRYVVLNPVRAGLCDHPSEWRWCASRFGLDVD